MIPKIKICGITSLDDAMAACDAGADALGFNFAPEAKRKHRYIEPEAAAAIIAQLPPFVATVAVTVNATPNQLREYLTLTDYVQLHGEESPEQCADLGRRGIKAFRLKPDFDTTLLKDYVVGAYLVDAYSSDARGGTGYICDWDQAKTVVAMGCPIILAGGLTPDNVTDAVQTVRPYGVDTAGGVENAPGKKDHEKLRAFVRNATRALSIS